MDDTYNIYFAGELMPGQDTSQVRQRLAGLFNANEATLDKLFSGKRQLVKRGCDKATALKYKQAMERAGARPIVTRAGDATPVAPDAAPSPEPVASAGSAADRIAAVAEGRNPESPDETGTLRLEPAGTDVLRPEERSTATPVNVDTSSLSVDAAGARLSAETPTPPSAPDTSHMSMGEVGDDIPNLDRGEPPPAPSTDALSLSPEGTDFSDCSDTEEEVLDLDLAGISLAPEGSAVLEEEYRKREQTAAPATDHLSLED